MSLGWAIVAIIVALIAGMAIGAVIGATAPEVPEPAPQMAPEPTPDLAVKEPRSRRAKRRTAAEAAETREPVIELAEAPAEDADNAMAETRIRSRRGGKRRADVPVDGPSTVEPTLELIDPDPTPEPKTVEKAAARTSDYVITSIGQPEVEPAVQERKEFELRPQLEGAARTALIEVSSALHGLRNALTEENRAKIQYEIKRELIRVRKTRKLEVKQALREFRARRDELHAPDRGEDA